MYEAYKNTVMQHGRHIYAKASDMAKATMCKYPQSVHAHRTGNLYCGALPTVRV